MNIVRPQQLGKKSFLQYYRKRRKTKVIVIRDRMFFFKIFTTFAALFIKIGLYKSTQIINDERTIHFYIDFDCSYKRHSTNHFPTWDKAIGNKLAHLVSEATSHKRRNRKWPGVLFCTGGSDCSRQPTTNNPNRYLHWGAPPPNIHRSMGLLDGQSR